MKKRIIITFGILGLLFFGVLLTKSKLFRTIIASETNHEEITKLIIKHNIQNGDIIFQTSLSGQSKAIQLATKSIYSHCGIIFKKGDHFFVFEVIQPVTYTPLEKWIARGKEEKFVIKRLSNSNEILNKTNLSRMKQIGEKFKGRNYDLTFEWSDEKIYCSELVWKVYNKATGIEIGKLVKLKDFDLSHEAVKQKMKERYGMAIPLNEKVISPEAIFKSELLTTVVSNY